MIQRTIKQGPFSLLFLLTVGLVLSTNLDQARGSPAATYYVAPTGSDTNLGSQTQPFQTIQKAADTATAGDQVFIKMGTYRERVVPVNSGTADHEIVYCAEPGAVVVLDGTGVPMPNDLAGLFEVSGKSHLRISGLRIIGVGPYADNAGILVQNSHFITVANNAISNTMSSGIGVWESDHVTIEGNLVEWACTGGWQEGISVALTDSFNVRSNRVLNCQKEGICIKHGSRNGTVTANQVERAQAVGIYVDAWDRHTFNIEVCQNVVNEAGSDGYSLASEMGGSLENIRLHSNVAYHNRYRGITVSVNGPGGAQGRHPMNGVAILNNTCFNNGWTNWGGGIAVDNGDAQNVVVGNNICSQNLYFQIAVGTDVSAQNAIIDHNLIEGYQGTEGETYGANSVQENPRFVNAAGADFHLRATSPAIDAGTNLDAILAMTDMDGQPRVFNNRVDVGADEAVVQSVGIRPVANGIETVWEVVVDARCQAQRCVDLAGKAWSPLGEVVTCRQERLIISDTNAIAAPGFYRLGWLKP